MKSLLIAGYIASITAMKIKKGYINPSYNYSHKMTPSSQYYNAPYAQVSPYHSQTQTQMYPQSVGLSQSYPTMNAMQVLPTSAPSETINQAIPVTTTNAGITQTLQPTAAIGYPTMQGATNYSPNFLGVQPSVIASNNMYSPYGQQYYTTPDGTQILAPIGPTYYQTNDPSLPQSGSFFDYFQ